VSASPLGLRSTAQRATITTMGLRSRTAFLLTAVCFSTGLAACGGTTIGLKVDVLLFQRPSPDMLIGTVCIGAGEYSDVGIYTPVRIFDPSGTVIAIGHLGGGEVVSRDQHVACDLATFIGTLPQESSYSIEVAKRGKHRYSLDQLVARGRDIAISLGDPQDAPVVGATTSTSTTPSTENWCTHVQVDDTNPKGGSTDHARLISGPPDLDFTISISGEELEGKSDGNGNGAISFSVPQPTQTSHTLSVTFDILAQFCTVPVGIQQ